MNKLTVCLVLGAVWFAHAADTVKVWRRDNQSLVTTLTNVVAYRPCEERAGCTNIVSIKGGKTNIFHANWKFEFKIIQ